MSGRHVDVPPTGERVEAVLWEGQGPGSQTVGDEPTAIERVWETLRRRKWWVIQAVVVVTALTALLTSMQQKQYTAGASLLFRDPATAVLDTNNLSDPARQAATNASLVTLPAVAAKAASIAGHGITQGEVAAAIKVSPSGDSDVVDIEATSPDPVRAAEIANGYGRAYIAFRAELDRAQLDKAATSLQRRYSRLTPEQRANASGVQLQGQIDRLALAQAAAGESAQLVNRAGVPSAPSQPKVKRNIILGLMLGLVIGAGIAFLRDRFDQSLSTPEELEEIFGAPLLARVPRIRKPTNITERTNIAELEAFRTLRANLRYFGVNRELDSILVSSPMSGDGKSTVALNLSMTMAAMGDRVVLVEADLHKPGFLDEGGLGGAMHGGLSSVLSGASLRDSLITIPVADPTGVEDTARSLTVLPTGPLPPNPSELLESSSMLELLSTLEDNFERVIIDSPAFTVVSDVRALVGRVSGVLIVSALNYTRRSAATEFRKQVQLLGGRPLGIVANLAPPSRGARYGGDEYYRAS